MDRCNVRVGDTDLSDHKNLKIDIKEYIKKIKTKLYLEQKIFNMNMFKQNV